MTTRGAAEIGDTESLADACGADALVLWAAQTLRPGVRAWTYGDGMAVASPALSNRDRLAVHGPVASVAALVESVLTWVGPSYRVLGPAALVAGVAGLLPELRLSGEFAWMETHPGVPPLSADSESGATWLGPADGPEVAEILQAALPESHALPGVAGVRRWAGIRSGGRLAAVAADAWSASAVGFVSGVATRPQLQGRGMGRAVVRFLLAAMRREHERVGLFVDAANAPAVALYRSLGMSLRPVAAAAVSDAPPGPC
jgi:GNAT superfamily N-acetyltransferase